MTATQVAQTRTAVLPHVSVVMAVRNEATFIERSLGSVLAQDYPAELVEIIIADGMSDDGTPAIIERIAADRPERCIRLIANPQRNVPSGLNAAIRAANGEIIIRIDGHAEIAPDYVREGVLLLLRTGADNVGGLAVSVGRGQLGETIALAEKLRFGLGGGAFRCATTEGEVDTVFMGIFRRDVFTRVGMFDEELVRNQDIELNGRIRRAGGRIVFSPRLGTAYFCRTTLRALWRQNFANGCWLFPTIAKTPGALSVRHFVPLTFVGTLLVGAVLAPWSRVARWLLACVFTCYAACSALASMLAAARHGWRFALRLPVVFAIMHLSYGMGSLLGLWRTLGKR